MGKPDTRKSPKTFEELAREIGADESGKKFERAFKKIARSKKPKPSKDQQSSAQGSKAKR